MLSSCLLYYRKARRSVPIIELRRAARKPWRNLPAKLIPAIFKTALTTPIQMNNAAASVLPLPSLALGASVAGGLTTPIVPILPALGRTITPPINTPSAAVASATAAAATATSPPSIVTGQGHGSSGGSSSGSGGGVGGAGTPTNLGGSDLQVVILD